MLRQMVTLHYEICHAKVDVFAIDGASPNGHLEVVKYIYETCHEKVDDEAVSDD